jgi:hypothetical protein
LLTVLLIIPPSELALFKVEMFGGGGKKLEFNARYPW